MLANISQVIHNDVIRLPLAVGFDIFHRNPKRNRGYTLNSWLTLRVRTYFKIALKHKNRYSSLVFQAQGKEP